LLAFLQRTHRAAVIAVRDGTEIRDATGGHE
jgi:hypothetical protein